MAPHRDAQAERYDQIRTQSQRLAEPLSAEDACVQSMPDASPAKWHLAHTTWFFETFVLESALPDYPRFDNNYRVLFNSYYNAVGEQYSRPDRGLLTRPAFATILEYRAHVDRHMRTLLDRGLDHDTAAVVEVGLHHEQQHQELLLTDLLHLFAQNPLHPEYRPSVPLSMPQKSKRANRWHAFEGGIYPIGHAGNGFAFDCEGPLHEVLIRPFELADTPVTVGQWIQFMEDGGYQNPLHWLSDGWAYVQKEKWQAPLYWQQKEGEWWTMTLHGFQPVNPEASVSHVSYFEADAYARWAGHRLPTEFGWETAVADVPINGHFADKKQFRPLPDLTDHEGARHLFGSVWEWTASPYTAYPGFRPKEGAVAEYNGKFMSGQIVLRGGSCVTPLDHIRPTYRNFFYPHQRWQFSGLRLARDC